MKRFARHRLGLTLSTLLTLTSVSCGKNVLEQYSSKTTDDALYYSAQQDMNARNYSAAITTLGKLSASYLGQRTVQFTLASAYSGRCGLDFIPFAFALTNIGSGITLMDVVRTQLSPVAGTSDCEMAESILRAVSAGGLGVFTDSNEALQMATIALSKVGAILATSTGTHAGAANPAFNGCTVTASSAVTTGLTDADVDQIGTGLTLAYNNLQVNTSFATAISGMTSICLQIAGAPFNDPLCAKTTTGFSANELKLLRGLVNYNAVGVGNDVSYIACP